MTALLSLFLRLPRVRKSGRVLETEKRDSLVVTDTRHLDTSGHIRRRYGLVSRRKECPTKMSRDIYLYATSVSRHFWPFLSYSLSHSSPMTDSNHLSFTRALTRPLPITLSSRWPWFLPEQRFPAASGLFTTFTRLEIEPPYTEPVR